MTSNKKFLIMLVGVAVVVASWIGWVSSRPADEKAMVTFLSVKDLVENNVTNRTKIGGIVQDGSIQISDTNLLDCTFVLQEGDAELPVVYKKTRPDLFKDGAEVIVTGVYRGGVFHADELQTKCASRYEGDLRDESSYKLNELDL